MRHWISDAKAVPIEAEIDRRGIRLAGRGKDRCGPCPVCGGTDRFAINIAKQVFNCRGCEARGDVIDLVRWLDRCGVSEACETLTGRGRPADLQKRPVVRAAPILVSDTQTDAETRQRAGALWREGVPIAGTLAEVYLAGRGLEVPDRDGRVLRFHGNCPILGERHPCLIALWRMIAGDAPTAIHRRPLSRDGRKMDTWKTLGSTAGAAIKLIDDVDVTYGLHVGEGLETTLRAMQVGLRPAWALGNAGGIERFPILGGIDALTILVDNDANYTGQGSAVVCAERWTAAGREVRLIISRTVGEDFDDIRRSA
jgi:putative DNA primase/helicase